MVQVTMDAQALADLICARSEALSEEAAEVIAVWYDNNNLSLDIANVDNIWTETTKSDFIFDALTEGEIESYYETIPSDAIPNWSTLVSAEKYYEIVADMEALDDNSLLRVVLEVEVNPAWHGGDDIILLIGTIPYSPQ